MFGGRLGKTRAPGLDDDERLRQAVTESADDHDDVFSERAASVAGILNEHDTRSLLTTRESQQAEVFVFGDQDARF